MILPGRKLFTEQFLRYVLVGLWNTVFGYACFALFTKLLDNVVPQSYLAGSVLSNIVSITVAFLGYKWFVFKTKGNYLREWCRCFGVYSGSVVLGLVLLPMMVFTIRHKFGYQNEAPYIAGALLTGVTVVMSFFGHKHFSFRRPAA
jgi:putative flippase GtrA